jgi:hypothetical protein
VILDGRASFLSSQNYNMPNNREWAVLIWLGVLLVFMLRSKEQRALVGQPLRTALNPKLLVPLVFMLAYIALEVWLGARISLWCSELINDTVVWVLVALSLFINSAGATRRPHFFRNRIAATLGITEFLALFTNLFALNLIAEVFPLPVLVLLVGVGVLAERKPSIRA